MAGQISTLESPFQSAHSEQTEVKQHLQTVIASSTSEPFHAAWMIFSLSVIRKSHFIHFHHLNVPCRAAIDIEVEEVMSPGCNYNRNGSQPSGRGGGGTNAHGVMWKVAQFILILRVLTPGSASSEATTHYFTALVSKK